MTDFGNQEISAISSVSFVDDTSLDESSGQSETKSESPRIKFQPEIRIERKATPYTIRRPSYLQYIEYS